jgi:hypothetical protein
MIKDELLSALLNAIPGGAVVTTVGVVSEEILNYAYYEWSRAAELTCDRGGLLACQNIEASCRALMKLAGATHKFVNELSLDEFIEQGRNFVDIDTTTLGKVQKVLLSRTMTHPWSVFRVNQLLKFYDDNEYNDVIQRHPDRKALGKSDGSDPITIDSITQTGKKALESTKDTASGVFQGAKGAFTNIKKGVSKAEDKKD